jgi:hypothetical protein
MSTTPIRTESEDQLKLRFQVEREFVQSLDNPNYLNFLAQREYLKELSFSWPTVPVGVVVDSGHLLLATKEDKLRIMRVMN